MKYQIVKRILGISLAVCTVYGSVRGAYATVSGAYAAAENNYAIEISDYAASSGSNTTVVAEADIADNADSYVPSESIESAAATEQEELLSGSEPKPEENEAVLPVPGTEKQEELLPDPETEEQKELLLEPETEEPEITLEEYLSSLRCGACGRKCSLLHPHCRNGKHKAQAAEQQYYETYAVS